MFFEMEDYRLNFPSYCQNDVLLAEIFITAVAEKTKRQWNCVFLVLI